jgi:hypothetical protein
MTADKLCYQSEIRFASVITVVVVQDVSALRRAGGIDGDSSGIIKVFKEASTFIATRTQPDAGGTWQTFPPPRPWVVLLSILYVRKALADVSLFFLQVIRQRGR